MSLSAAKSRINQVKEMIESNRVGDADRTLEAALGFLRPLPDAEQAPLLGEIEALRAALASRMSDEEERNLRAAGREVKLAREQIAAGQDLLVDTTIGRAQRYLEHVRDVHKAALVAELAGLRAPAAVATAPTPTPAAVAPAPSPAMPAPTPAPATPAPPAPSPTPPATASSEDAVRAADDAVRQLERDVLNDRSFDHARYLGKRAAADAALAAADAALAAADPSHPALAAIRARRDDADRKADALVVDAFTFAIDGAQRGAARDLASFEEARSRVAPKELEPADLIARQLAWADQVRAQVEPARAQLTSPRGVEALAKADAWLAAVDAKLTELRLLADACALFRVEADVEQIGRIKLVAAIESAEWNFDKDPERVVLAWDAVKKLIGPLQEARFAGLPEVAKVLARHHALAQRVATELRPLLARRRVAPLVASATHYLELLRRDTDEQDLDKVLQWRAALRAALAPLQRDWADDPDAQDFLATAARGLRRAEQELGDELVLREIQAAEIHVKPLVERVERALALGSAVRVREHAPRLRAHLGGLAPFLAQQRARLLDERARVALDRIAIVLGAEAAAEIAAAEAVPAVAIDLAADTKVQAVLTRLAAAFEAYRAEHAQAQLAFEAAVDVVAGTAGHAAFRDVESAASAMIKAARRAEEIGDELRRLDRGHPLVAEVEAAAPRLVKRAQAWKAQLGRRFDYAGAIGRARTAMNDAERARRDAAGDAHDALRAWPEVLDRLGAADLALAEAAAILPDDRDEADQLAATSAAWRDEARATLAAVCLAEATRRARANDNRGAAQCAEVLRAAVPDAAENAQIAAAIAGTADARQKAHAEIAARVAELHARAAAAAAARWPAYDAWAADKPPVVALAGTIVADLAAYQGKWIAGRASSLGVVLYDEPRDLNGDIYQVDYDPAVATAITAGMKRLDGLYATIAEQVAAAHGVSGVATFTQHTARDASYLCEIVGVTSYTPRREIRDAAGRLVGTLEGAAYPVPRLVIRGVASHHFVVVPGHAPSLDALSTEGLIEG